MYIGFSKRLVALGGLRIGVGKRLSGATGWIVLIFLGMFYLMWYMMIACLWIFYGFGYLFFYLPFKGIVHLSEKKKAQQTRQQEREG